MAPRRRFTRTTDGALIGLPSEFLDLQPSGWFAYVETWDGVVVYNGPCPVPDEFCTLSTEELESGRMYLIHITKEQHE